MGDKSAAKLEENELLAAVKGELAKHGEQVAENIKTMRAKVEEVDARVDELKDADDVKGKYFEGLRNGNPTVFDGRKPTEEILEGLRADASVRYVDVGGVKIPVIETAPSSRRAGLQPFRMIRALMTTVMGGGGSHIDYDQAALTARRWGDDATAGHLEEQRDNIRALRGGDDGQRQAAQRALGTQELGSGAGLVGPEMAAQIIDYLHPKTAVRASGVTVVPMNGGLRMSFFDRAMQASYVGENEGTVPTKPRDGQLVFTPKILQAIVAMSNELLKQSSFSVDALLRQMMVKVLASREDLALIRGQGSEHSPKGLAYWVKQAILEEDGQSHVFNRTLDAGAPTHLTIRKDALKAQRLVEDADVDFASTGWILRTRTAYGLMAIVSDLTGQMIFPELRGGEFMGHPYRKTTQIPINEVGDGVGVGTLNKTEAYFGSFQSMILAEQESIEIKAYEGGTYKTASGFESGITNRETVVTACISHDFGAGYRGQELAKIESVDWGA